MQFVDFKKSLLNKIEPIYIISGKELYLIENALNNLISACNITLPELNLAYVDANITLDEIFTQCETLPFCSEKRIIIAKDYPLNANNNLSKLENYLSNANSTTCLIFTNIQLIESKKITCVNCDSISIQTLQSKIISDLKKIGYEIQLPALNRLIQNINGSITSAMSEISKLTALSLESKIITIDDVEKVCSKNDLEYNIFMLTDAIAKKDNNTALSLMKRIINEDNTKGIVYFLHNYFRRLFISIASKNSSDEQVAEVLGVKPYAIKIAKQQARTIGANKILRAIEMLEKIDTSTKSTFASLEQELYLFLLYTLS